ncbi:MAG: FecR domain-containing protein [Elusimicrobia bacterium]|nr:FecR domain-containing protein [Elusimicrobiota bacterium]
MPLLWAILAAWARAGTDIRSVDGGVAVFLPSLNDWRQVQKTPFGLQPGDKIKLKPLSKAELVFEDGTWIRMSDDAHLSVVQDNEKGSIVQLDGGALDVAVKRLDHHVFEVRAPGATITLRADRAKIRITPKKVVVVEVTRGLADVQPSVGPSVQVPDEHRLEVPPGKPPGLPVPLREARQVLDKLPAAPPGMSRKFPRRKVSADPDAAGPDAPAGKALKDPELGADALGIAKPPPPAKDPPLGLESLGIEPALGTQSLGLKDAQPKPKDPALGARSLGLKEPGPEPKAPPRYPKPASAEPEVQKPRPFSSDISPAFEYQDYGVKPPKPAKRKK